MDSSLSSALDALAAEGLNWCCFVPAAARPVPPECVSEPGAGLLLLLSMGGAFGERTPYSDAPYADAFDVRAAQLCAALLRAHFASAPARLLYPGPSVLDLRSWLASARVEFDSPLGIGIRPDCGPWFAVRAAAWVVASAAQQELIAGRYPALEGQSPCATCDGKPCLSACPVDALRQGAQRLKSCVEQRLAPASSCADRCHSRLACPIGSSYRYSEAQLRYHYAQSLRSIVRWKSGGGA